MQRILNFESQLPAACRAEHAGYPSARHARTELSNIYRWVGGHTVGKRYMDGEHATHSKQRVLNDILSGTFFRWPGRHSSYGGSPSHREVLCPVEQDTTAKRAHGMHERSTATLPATLSVLVSYSCMTGADAYGICVFLTTVLRLGVGGCRAVGAASRGRARLEGGQGVAGLQAPTSPWPHQT